MEQIDLDNWSRKAHFEFFRRADLPFYNVNTNVDITGLREFARANSLSFNSTLMFATIRSLTAIENFRYRLQGESVFLHRSLHPSFAHIKPNEDLFSLITLDFADNLREFDEAVKRAIESSTQFFDLDKLRQRSNFVFFSSMPWLTFTGVDHTLNLKKDDAIPRITWGKYFENQGATLLPYNIRVNHIFVDGIHVGRFFEELGEEIERIVGNQPGQWHATQVNMEPEVTVRIDEDISAQKPQGDMPTGSD